MDFSYGEEQRTLRNRAEQFADEHRETLQEYYNNHRFPKTVYQKGTDIGPGVIIPEEYGGKELGAIEYSLVNEQIGLFQTSFQLARAIIVNGSEDQKEQYLPELANCEYPGAITISEPNTGSSLKNMETVAVKQGDEFVLNGQKTHANLGAEAGLHKVYAMTEEGLTTFLVGKENPGLEITNKLDPIGLRNLPIYDLELDECHVSKDAVLGDVGGGYDVFFSTFNFSRIGNASSLIGYGKRAIEDAIDYASDREIDDENVVTDFQGIRWTIADSYTRLEAASRLRDQAAWRIDNGKSAVMYTSMAKLMAAYAALPATTHAIQITGAHGLYYDQPFITYFHDAKTLEVAGGSREIMRNVIADQILDEA